MFGDVVETVPVRHRLEDRADTGGVCVPYPRLEAVDLVRDLAEPVRVLRGQSLLTVSRVSRLRRAL